MSDLSINNDAWLSKLRSHLDTESYTAGTVSQYMGVSRRFVWEDPNRAKRLADDYNFRFNNIRLRDFDGSHLTLPGMVRTSLRDDDLSPHQKNAVWRILQGGSPLLAHVVGAGIMPPGGLCRDDSNSYYFGAVLPLTCAA